MQMKKIDAHIHLNQALYFDEIAKKANHENTTMHLENTFKRLEIVHGIVMGHHDLDFKNHCYPEFLSYCIGQLLSGETFIRRCNRLSGGTFKTETMCWY